MPKLTIGYRCRIKSTSSWNKNWGYGDREVLLQERSGGEFSVLVLKKGENVPLDKHWETVDNSIAWLTEDDLELVDKKIATNIKFMDWYEEHEEEFCPDCGYWEEGAFNSDDEAESKWFDKKSGDYLCPKCGCIVG